MVKEKKRKILPVRGLAYCAHIHPPDLLDVEVPRFWGIGSFTPTFPLQFESWGLTLPPQEQMVPEVHH